MNWMMDFCWTMGFLGFWGDKQKSVKNEMWCDAWIHLYSCAPAIQTGRDW